MKSLGWRAGFLCLVALGGCSSLTKGRPLWSQAITATHSVRLLQRDANARLVASGFLKSAEVIWMLDSGASFDSVTAAGATQHGLPVSGGNSVAHLSDGELHEVQRVGAWPAGIFAEDQRPKNLVALPADDLSEAGIVGTLGLLGLAPPDRGLALDMPHGVLHVLDKRLQPSELDRLRVLWTPVDLKTWGKGAKLPTVSATIDGQTMELLIDTGTPITVVFADTDVGVRATTRRDGVRYFVRDNVDSVVVVRGHVRVAGFAGHHRIGVWPRILPGVDGVLGLDVLRGCVLVYDGNRGALGCQAASRGAAPTLDMTKMKAVGPPRPLGKPAPLAPGIVARLGCKSVTSEDVKAWAQLRGLSGTDSAQAAVRALINERFARSLHVEVGPDQIDSALTNVRAQANLVDDAAWLAALKSYQTTPAQYRQQVADQLLEYRLVNALNPQLLDGVHGDAAHRKRMDEFLGSLANRLAVVETRGACTEVWPRYHIEDLVFVGFAPDVEQAIRLAVGRLLNGGAMSLGAAGLLPEDVRRTIAEVLAKRGVSGGVEADDRTDRLRVTLRHVAD